MAQQLSISYQNLASIILKQINKFRNNPIGILLILDERLQSFDGNNYLYKNNKNIRVATQEGPIPIKQLKAQLPNVGRLNKFVWSYELHCIADRRARDLAKNSELEENPPKDGPILIKNLSSLDELVQAQVSYTGQISQHFVYGYCDPQDIILELIIDDGNPKRQNRQQLLNPKLKHIGIGIHEHHKYMFVIVLILATEISVRKYRQNSNTGNYSPPPPPIIATNILQQQGQTGCGSRICSIF